MLLTLAFLACGQLVKAEFVEKGTVAVKADTKRAYLVLKLDPITTTALVVPYDGNKFGGIDLAEGETYVQSYRLPLIGEFKRLDNPVKCQQIFSEAVREFRKVKFPAKSKNKNDRRLYPNALKKAQQNQTKAIRAVADKYRSRPSNSTTSSKSAKPTIGRSGMRKRSRRPARPSNSSHSHERNGDAARKPR
jgi:hypothetical protein